MVFQQVTGIRPTVNTSAPLWLIIKHNGIFCQGGGASEQFETLCGLSGFSDMILRPLPHLSVSTIWFSVRFKLLATISQCYVQNCKEMRIQTFTALLTRINMQRLLLIKTQSFSWLNWLHFVILSLYNIFLSIKHFSFAKAAKLIVQKDPCWGRNLLTRSFVI